MLRIAIVKDDSGSYAVFTDQGSPASQMTAAKLMDVTSRLPECAGQAADAVSAYTQVRMKDAKDDGIHLQAHRGGTSLNGIGSELTIFSLLESLFVTVGFVYS